MISVTLNLELLLVPDRSLSIYFTQNGAHLAATLKVTELTLSLHSEHSEQVFLNKVHIVGI